MTQLVTLHAPGTLGNNTGHGSDGVLIGDMTPLADGVTYAALAYLWQTDGKCITDDGGVYVNESTPFNEATTDDVEIMLTAVDDANYFGHADHQPTALDLVISTQGVADATPAVLAWEYSKGSGTWGTLAGVSDGTSAFTAGAGTVSVTWTAPTDMAKDTVDGVSAYWIRARHASGNAHATGCQLTRGYVKVAVADATFTDGTTAVNTDDTTYATASHSYPAVNDAFYIVAENRFCGFTTLINTASSATLTRLLEYWNGTSWATIPTYADYSSGFSAGTSTYYTQWAIPSDWTACTTSNGPNGNAGWAVRFRISAFTSQTTAPLIDLIRPVPVVEGSTGIRMAGQGRFTRVDMSAPTNAGSTADSVFMLMNVTRGHHTSFTWTKGTGTDSASINLTYKDGDQIVLKQVTEDGTSEIANATFYLKAS